MRGCSAPTRHACHGRPDLGPVWSVGGATRAWPGRRVASCMTGRLREPPAARGLDPPSSSVAALMRQPPSSSFLVRAAVGLGDHTVGSPGGFVSQPPRSTRLARIC